MKNWNWSAIGFVFFMLIVVVFSVFAAIGISAEIDEYEANIGKDVVINNDTLTIVNGSFIMSTYELSNGLKINDEYLELLEIL